MGNVSSENLLDLGIAIEDQIVIQIRRLMNVCMDFSTATYNRSAWT